MDCCNKGHTNKGSHKGHENEETQEKQVSWVAWIMLLIVVGLLLFGLLR